MNVLVHKEENKYLLYRQTKYGLEKESLAVLEGSLIRRRQGNIVQGVVTELVAEEMKFLGKYRVQVNRGGGSSTFI